MDEQTNELRPQEVMESAPAKEDSPRLSGQSRRRRGLSKKKKRIYHALLIFFGLIMAFSIFMLIRQILGYQRAGTTYQDFLHNIDFVTIDPPAETKASEAPTEAPTVDGTAESVEEPSEEPSTEAPTEETETETEPYKDPYALSDMRFNFASLRAANSDIVGYLQGLGDELVLPVVQCGDNTYYLDHMVNREQNSCGCPFVDYRNRYLQDDITYIYGHNMINYQMFGCLKRYLSQSYYNHCPIIRLHTPSGIRNLRVYAVVRTDASEWLPMNFSDEGSFYQTFSSYARRSAISPGFSVSYGEKFVCLYTCSYHVQDGRLLVICRLE